MPLLTLVVIAGSADEFSPSNYGLEADELVLLDNTAAQYGGLSTIGNHYLATTQSDVLGLVHADVEFGLGAVRKMAQEALSRSCVAGIVGITSEGEYTWSRFHREAPVKVSTLDSCSIFLPVQKMREVGLHFDAKNFPTFHCVVEDFCLAAAHEGFDILVPSDIDAGHRGTRHLRSDWQRGHQDALQTLNEKWPSVPFCVT